MIAPLLFFGMIAGVAVVSWWSLRCADRAFDRAGEMW